jgi:endonuclease/exonuclease/phosphatase (EEP) superfamily protein YafD
VYYSDDATSVDDMRGVRIDLKSFASLRDVWAWVILLPAGGITAIGLFADVGWPLELFPHFAIQCTAAQLLVILYCGLRRKLFLALLGLALLLVALVPIIRYYWAAPASTMATSHHFLRAMTINVSTRNDRADLVQQAIAAEKPDIILLTEATATWVAALAPLRGPYPYQLGDTTDSIFSILLLSRMPFEGAEIHRLQSGNLPIVRAKVCMDEPRLDGPCLTVVGIHAPSPITRARVDDRDNAFRMVAELLARAGNWRTVLLGDFNATPWSAAFRRLLTTTGLRDSAGGFGVNSTWGSPSLLFGQLIDHVLVAPKLPFLIAVLARMSAPITIPSSSICHFDPSREPDLQSVGHTLLRAMIAAAKADGFLPRWTCSMSPPIVNRRRSVAPGDPHERH